MNKISTGYDLVEIIDMLSEKVITQTTTAEKKSKGQFFTPPSVAKYMANLANIKNTQLRLLDPGSGTGILVAALVERLIREGKNVELYVDVFEKDKRIIPYLRESLEICKSAYESYGNNFSYRIFDKDFILNNEYLFKNDLLKSNINLKCYDLIISNPPYYKVNKNHIYSKILSEYVYGQPNVYFMFMAIAEKLLVNDGQLIFITPRSYCSGTYFRKFRGIFLKEIDPDHIHLFESRKKIFKPQKVLQENVILSGIKRRTPSPYIIISSSKDSNIEKGYYEQSFKKSQIINPTSQNNIIRIPTNYSDKYILKLFDSWSDNLSNYKMKVSTGPVVLFRHKKFIVNYQRGKNYPLIMMKHIKNMDVIFPLLEGNDKGLVISAQNKGLLLDRGNYIIIKRITSKEQEKRIHCAPFFGYRYDFEKVGFENHLNYIHKGNEKLKEDEVLGISAFLNSKIVDRYFRIINGNTQVNASDLQYIPLPHYEILVEIGRKIYNNKLFIKDVDKYILDIYMGKSNYINLNTIMIDLNL